MYAWQPKEQHEGGGATLRFFVEILAAALSHFIMNTWVTLILSEC